MPARTLLFRLCTKHCTTQLHYSWDSQNNPRRQLLEVVPSYRLGTEGPGNSQQVMGSGWQLRFVCLQAWDLSAGFRYPPTPWHGGVRTLGEGWGVGKGTGSRFYLSVSLLLLTSPASSFPVYCLFAASRIPMKKKIRFWQIETPVYLSSLFSINNTDRQYILFG